MITKARVGKSRQETRMHKCNPVNYKYSLLVLFYFKLFVMIVTPRYASGYRKSLRTRDYRKIIFSPPAVHCS
jgi:hypothetical protein